MISIICMCMCLSPSTVNASSVWISWDTREQINDFVLKTFDCSASSIHRYFGMQNLTFQLAVLSCSYTRSEHSHDLTSIYTSRFQNIGPSFTIIRRRLRYALHYEPICFCVSTHERVRNLSRKGYGNQKLQYRIQSSAKYLDKSRFLHLCI